MYFSSSISVLPLPFSPCPPCHLIPRVIGDTLTSHIRLQYIFHVACKIILVKYKSDHVLSLLRIFQWFPVAHIMKPEILPYYKKDHPLLSILSQPISPRTSITHSELMIIAWKYHAASYRNDFAYVVPSAKKSPLPVSSPICPLPLCFCVCQNQLFSPPGSVF